MACTSCSSGGGCSTTSASGCGSKGSCSSGCTRLNVFDWLQDLDLPSDFKEFDIVEIRFKGGRKDFFRNTSRLPLITGDAVVVEAASNGWHLGHVSLKGELVRLQMKKKKVPLDSKDIKGILRVATDQDVERWNAVRDLETGTMFRARSVVDELRLKMKLSDVEYQADRTRATFFYSAEDRVDFRDLIKRLADEFRVRVEMRQISLRHEAGRLGGIGSCGRELCCSTWLTDFKSVSTTAARYQNLSLNPAKLSGQCGRLKCCLNYELDTYLDALKDIPQVQRPLLTEKGDYVLQKTDIFKRKMWFAVRGDNNWVVLPTERVREVQEMNKRGEKPDNLLAPVREEEKAPEVTAIVEGSLERLDDKIKGSKRTKRKKTKEKPVASAAAPAGTKAPRPATPKATTAEPDESVSSEAGEAAEGSSGETRRPRGAAARPLNRRGRGRGEGKRNDAPRAEGEAPAGDARPPRNSEGRPPRNAAPGSDAAKGTGEPGGERRGGRNSRRGGSRSGGPAGGATPPTPAS
ncbi:Cell fate regulator YaaT, PSP1 superfamily (controls sporulation, competence, biofilm development) [Hymenobacter gelipurpurascens]|uniref:Cell fate regulator YaaT, PSP1 superfamily (Controls sporulation, competence, biofilm development) n=1 Tax=Hymenobacter gelipurpurascens TaxID=89968 RepID=A0A212UAK4_9BACT|nr:regulatory iron-sulfur-containing complex subunit RicT [Hymenobacter gelipurpurascens]SNC75253.1 Cell fate regulator YaaT, PSP1 superfamily (controls sporulation, competence, biofilm development) [Hymenobacter gelipurpurascens]